MHISPHLPAPFLGRAVLWNTGQRETWSNPGELTQESLGWPLLSCPLPVPATADGKGGPWMLPVAAPALSTPACGGGGWLPLSHAQVPADRDHLASEPPNLLLPHGPKNIAGFGMHTCSRLCFVAHARGSHLSSPDLGMISEEVGKGVREGSSTGTLARLFQSQG